MGSRFPCLHSSCIRRGAFAEKSASRVFGVPFFIIVIAATIVVRTSPMRSPSCCPRCPPGAEKGYERVVSAVERESLIANTAGDGHSRHR